MRLTTHTVSMGLALVLLGCSEKSFVDTPTPVIPDSPDILVTPPALEWDTLMALDAEVKQFTIKSRGATPLRVDDITIEGSQAFAILSPTAYEIQPEDEVVIDVTFSPLQVENAAVAIVHSNDGDEPETEVQLLGFGAVPELTITPDEHDFGTRFIPCADTLTLDLANTGGDVLTIDDIGHVSDIDYTLANGNILPVSLNPGESVTVDVTYTPTFEGTTTGVLEVLSNDPRGVVGANQEGTAAYAQFTSDTHVVPIDPPVDILFAVDQSCSMDSISGLVANNFSSFINQIDQATNDWAIGVANIGEVGQPNGPAGCFVSGVINNTTPNYTSTFQSDVQFGSDPSGDDTYSERLTQLVDISLSKTAPGGCNSGFLRPGALLHVIMVTDEPNYSPEAWTYYLSNYESYVADPTLLKVSGIVDQGLCGSGNNGYLDIVDATGGETINICAPDWANSLQNLGAASLNGVSNFELNNPADGASIQVTVNGMPRTDWAYDQNANEVQFNAPLTGGDEVVIEYGIAVACP